MRGTEPWFVARDVAEILEYATTNAMTRRLESEDKLPTKSVGEYSKDAGNAVILNSEAVFYSAAIGLSPTLLTTSLPANCPPFSYHHSLIKGDDLSIFFFICLNTHALPLQNGNLERRIIMASGLKIFVISLCPLH
jgi:hypothetical protein